ncbi:MAG: hypothetical protein ABIS50_15795 [Luteolibacter sp.]|uniref:hypothetical protein n=1 Tax=Luteolibacter sp. TaxID=1962973 RepID=UPI003266D38A
MEREIDFARSIRKARERWNLLEFPLKSPPMASFAEIELLAMQLTVSERTVLATHLLHSLPPEFDEDADEDTDSDTDSGESLTLEELKRSVGR